MRRRPRGNPASASPSLVSSPSQAEDRRARIKANIAAPGTPPSSPGELLDLVAAVADLHDTSPRARLSAYQQVARKLPPTERAELVRTRLLRDARAALGRARRMEQELREDLDRLVLQRSTKCSRRSRGRVAATPRERRPTRRRSASSRRSRGGSGRDPSGGDEPPPPGKRGRPLGCSNRHRRGQR